MHVVIINDEEARELSGESNLVKAARVIRGLGPKRVVIKRGENGVLMTHRDGFFAAPGMPLEKVCDPTGAGDAFCAALAFALATGLAARDAVAFGNAAGSLAVRTLGAAPAMPDAPAVLVLAERG